MLTECPQEADKFLGMHCMELRRVSNRAFLQKSEQMIGRGPITVDRLDRGAKHLFVMLQPVIPQIGNGDRLEAERCRSADFELGIDLGGHLLGGFAVGTDARAPAAIVFMVAEVPDPVAKIGLNTTDAKRRRLARHESLRESSRYKTPQRTPQTGNSETISEMQKPV